MLIEDPKWNPGKEYRRFIKHLSKTEPGSDSYCLCTNYVLHAKLETHHKQFIKLYKNELIGKISQFYYGRSFHNKSEYKIITEESESILKIWYPFMEEQFNGR